MAESAAPGLTSEQLSSFNKDGYLIIRNALRPETVASLLNETHSLLENFSLKDHPPHALLHRRKVRPCRRRLLPLVGGQSPLLLRGGRL
ncbi:uncharacterized protein TrAtP1_004028 [Trichoderma atroviride]|uniref:uncharacterized protein n=1 Tax=Hypocrea atroviridis TaxID=63577 RepID=UPI0033187652|nr:hypothetical protein TrAtP1_004028 [Trichoderma atroviride]